MVKYSAFDGQFESAFEKTIDVSQEFSIPKKKKDEPPKPLVKGSVIPPPKECQPKECLDQALGDVKEPGTFFDGRCLDEVNYKEAINNVVGCQTTFNDVIDKFNY